MAQQVTEKFPWCHMDRTGRKSALWEVQGAGSPEALLCGGCRK